MLPVVVTYNLPAGNSTGLAAVQAATSLAIALTTGLVISASQRRIIVTSGGNDSALNFKIVGLNAAGFTVSELLAGANATFSQSNLDYSQIISITPQTLTGSIGTTASTVSVGLNGVGSSLWNIVNWHAMPSNVSYGCIVQSGSATFSIQYTYDDPNNLPPGVGYPQPFTLSTINGTAVNIDGFSNEPMTAWRLLISSGTGTIRAIGTQGGIGSP